MAAAALRFSFRPFFSHDAPSYWNISCHSVVTIYYTYSEFRKPGVPGGLVAAVYYLKDSTVG